MERDKKYSEESFWLKTVNLREMFQDDRFTNLYDVQTQVNKFYSLALENSMEQSTIQEWQQHVLTVSTLLDSLKNKSHTTALKDLKKVFGGTRGLNEANTKLVDSILRNSQREEPVVQRVVDWPGWVRNQSFHGPYQDPRQMQGNCHFCPLPGHFARDCPAQRFGPPMPPFNPFGFEPFRPPKGAWKR